MVYVGVAISKPIEVLENSKERMSKIKHKFGAIRCERNGFKFPSKLERSYYDKLKSLEKRGSVLFFLMQTAFHLPGNIKYLVDFTIFWCDGQVTFVDTKGIDTPISKLKRKQVETIYPIKIDVVRKV